MTSKHHSGDGHSAKHVGHHTVHHGSGDVHHHHYRKGGHVAKHRAEGGHEHVGARGEPPGKPIVAAGNRDVLDEASEKRKGGRAHHRKHGGRTSFIGHGVHHHKTGNRVKDDLLTTGHSDVHTETPKREPGGRIHGKHPHARLDKRRRSGGRAGSDSAPLSSAHHTIHKAHGGAVGHKPGQSDQKPYSSALKTHKSERYPHEGDTYGGTPD
jgi:hypothetical protein